MKKAMFTLLIHQKWWRQRFLSLLFLIVWGLPGSALLQAQIVMDYSATENTCKKSVLLTCDTNAGSGSTSFTDDGTIDGNYGDSRARRDTVEICPNGSDQRVKLTITEFDLEEGDTLFAFDANKETLRSYVVSGSGLGTGAGAPFGLGSGTGTGVSKGFGGWLQASCNPLVNASGCITFIFQTDGDNRKGKGWEAWVECETQKFQLGPVNIASKILTVDSAAYGHITIPAPVVIACGDTLPTTADSVNVVIKNQLGQLLKDTILTFNGMANSFWDTFAIGVYSVEYTLRANPSKKLLVPFHVQAPSLVCNDNIIIPFGSGCEIRIRPDDFLEQPADTITDTMYYNLTITLGSGKDKVVKTTKNYNNHGVVEYPALTAEDIKNAGLSPCGGVATVTIERIYYELGGTATICNNGIQRTTCETGLQFIDQTAPFISVTSDIDTLIVHKTAEIAQLFEATAIDNCDTDIPVSIEAEVAESDPCFNDNGDKNVTKATVTFTATDACGNIGKTTREVTLLRPEPASFIARAKDLTLECNELVTGEGMPGLRIGTLKNGQFTVKDTIALSTEDYVCGYILTRKDVEIPSSDCGRKMYRYWSVVDWCNAEVGPIAIDTQLIKFTDTKAPRFAQESGSTRLVEVDVYDCTFDINDLERPIATDNCSDPDVWLDSVFRVEDGSLWSVPAAMHDQLDVDSFYLRWIASDICHEQSINDTLMQLVVIRDLNRPTAVCIDQLNISVGSNVTVIDTGDVDAGSYDACGIMKKEISRDGINFGPTVSFTCEDIKDTIPVYFRVTDMGGNTNTCWFNVLPEDKIKPVCRSLAEGLSFANGDALGKTNQVQINCNDFKVAAIQDRNHPTIEELAAIGGPLPDPIDNCPDAQNIELEPIVLSSGICARSTYQRRWIARDIWGNESVDTCYQTITINSVEDWRISFPEDVSLTCPVETATMGDSVILMNGSCDRLAVSVESKMFTVVQDACFKVVKTYHIINWCNYNPGDPATHNFNADNIPSNRELRTGDISDLSYITYTQIIKVDDKTGPVITMGEITDTCLLGNHDGKSETIGTKEACGEIRTFTASATDCVSEAGSELSFNYKIYKGSIANLEAGKAELMDESENSTEGNEAFVLVHVLPGTYTAEFEFFDNCGNTSVARKEYHFTECKKPTPYVLNGIAIELGQTSGTVDIWATDFDQGSYDNCTEKENLRFRMWHVSLGIGPPETLEGVLDSLPTAITFNCNYLGTQIVYIYVIDESDNFDYVATFVQIQDNMRLCDSGGDNDNMVAGDIVNMKGESIEGVEVMVSGGQVSTTTTEADGHFDLMLPRNGDFVIAPHKADAPLNGVSTFDLVLISKHILGISTLDDPYKYIAADVNKSGSITAFDMVQLRQLILNILPDFPNNSSWRFVDAEYQFQTENPVGERFKETRVINNLTEDQMQVDFVGVKIGDVNGSARVSNLYTAGERSSQVFELQLKEQYIRRGEEVKVPIYARNLETIQGFQYTLNFNGLEWVQIEEGLLERNHINTRLTNKGILTTSWNGALVGEERLYTLVFKATRTARLSELINISSDLTPAEAYDQQDRIQQLALNFEKLAVTKGFELQQNAPNPFSDETVISFHLPTAGKATLRIMDAQGKILKSIRNSYTKGHHQIRLDAQSLGASGVLHYQLESVDQIAVKKMIVVD